MRLPDITASINSKNNAQENNPNKQGSDDWYNK
jgi:hypothetical protein